LLELLLQTQVLLLSYSDALHELTVSVLLELGHLDALALAHFQSSGYLQVLHIALLQLMLQSLYFELEQLGLLVPLAAFALALPPSILQLSLPVEPSLLDGCLLVGDLRSQGVLLVEHVVDDFLDAVLVVEALEVAFLLGLVVLALPQQPHLVLQPNPPLLLGQRLLVALLPAVLDLLPELHHSGRQPFAAAEGHLNLALHVLAESMAVFAIILVEQLLQVLVEGVVGVQQQVGALLEPHVLVELLLPLLLQLLELLVLAADEPVESVDLVSHCAQVLLILRDEIARLLVPAQALREFVDPGLLLGHHVVQLFQDADEFAVLLLDVGVFGQGGPDVVLELPDLGRDAVHVGAGGGRRGVGEDAAVGQLGRGVGKLGVGRRHLAHNNC
jgi:hypothetical protein